MEVKKTVAFDRWLRRLKNRSARSVIADHLLRVEETGNLGKVRSVGDGVWEKKISYAGGYRLYYFLQTEESIILLYGGDKSTQARDIVRAKKIKKGMK